MNDFKLPRSTLDKLPTALLKGVMVALLEKADENGMLIVSIREFAKQIGIEYQPLRTALKHIYANALANAIATQRLTQITINNIDDYYTSARKQQRKANAMANAISDKQKSAKFIPPTEQQVAEYVAQMGYHFNPESFIPHYQSKGWKVGDQPMKDWKAACRTWETKWKEKHGEQFYHQTKPNAAAIDTPAARKESRDNLRRLAEGVVAQSSGGLASLFDGRLPVAESR